MCKEPKELHFSLPLRFIFLLLPEESDPKKRNEPIQEEMRVRMEGERVIRGVVDGRIGVRKEGEGGLGVNGAGLNQAEIQSVNKTRGRWKEEQN